MTLCEKKNPELILHSKWLDDGSKTGQIELRLTGKPHSFYPAPVRMAFTTLVRIPPQTTLVGAEFVARTANYHELAPLGPLEAGADGLLWQVTLPELSHRPHHCTDGPSSAFLILPDHGVIDIECLPLERAGADDAPAANPSADAEPALPGEAIPPALGLLPMANRVDVRRWRDRAPARLILSEVLRPTGTIVNALYERLFAKEPPFGDGGAGLAVSHAPLQQPTGAGEGAKGSFRLRFSPQDVVVEADEAARLNALIALAQIWHANHQDPALWAFPEEGSVEDWPQQDWRGMHLDVSRQFYKVGTVKAFLDCLAWHRFNRFHWHLTDDEGWRLQSRTYPHLTELGAWRGHGLLLYPQHGSGAHRYGGFYHLDEVRDILHHAGSLGIDVVPEIDVPGHCHAAMMALPELVDPSALRGGASVQGYVNNALNPGLGATWLFLETIFGEVADLFPGPFVHIGGDEVADGAWSGSRAANSWARAKGHLTVDGQPDSMKMQAAMLRFVSDRLVAAGKVPLAWEEAAKGGGLDPEQAILMAWTNARSAHQLTQLGYRVIMCPGEAYYLDMAQSDDWQEPGLSWAGPSSPATTYDFDPVGPVADCPEKLVGIEGCIWSENLTGLERFNHMVFPRLSAIAESAWTKPENKDWASFERRQGLMPRVPLS
nr:family 20 glycosylhydrolase [uncultured Cohaesibacter sp.]